MEMTSNNLVEIDSNEPNSKGLGTKGIVIRIKYTVWFVRYKYKIQFERYINELHIGLYAINTKYILYTT